MFDSVKFSRPTIPPSPLTRLSEQSDGFARQGAVDLLPITSEQNEDRITAARATTPDLSQAYSMIAAHLLAQVAPPEPPEPEPDKEPIESKDPIGESVRARDIGPLSEGELRRAESSGNAEFRLQAYENARSQLFKLDPSSRSAKPEVRSPSWRPSASDIKRVREELHDAKVGTALGYTPEQYRDLARDPDHGGSISDSTREERDAAIFLQANGTIRGPLTRGKNGADFTDTYGIEYDVKSYRSKLGDGFNLKRSSDSIDGELRAGERVIVNTAHMSSEDVIALKAEGVRRGWGNRVIYSTSVPISQLDL